MSVFVSWAAAQGLDLSVSVFRKSIGSSNVQEMIVQKLDLINQKLDTLLGAPYRQARMHLAAGAVEKAKDKLIEAMSLNELDLPALAMYCHLLSKESNSALAADYYELLLRRFGPHPTLLPREIVVAYGKYIDEAEPLRDIPAFRLQKPDEVVPESFPTEIRCSLSCLIVTWQPKPGTLGGGALSSFSVPPTVALYDWQGNTLLARDLIGDGSGILSCTDGYLTLLVDTGFFRRKLEPQVFRTAEGTRAPYAGSVSEVSHLFCDAGDTVTIHTKQFTHLPEYRYAPPSFDLRYAGARIRTGATSSGWVDVSPAA